MNDVQNEDFDLNALTDKFITAEQHQEEISGRDKKINSLLEQINTDKQSFETRLGEMSTALDSFKQSLAAEKQQTEHQKLELTEDERLAVGDNITALEKIAQRTMTPQQQQIASLERQIAELKAGNGQLSGLEGRLNALDDVVNITARTSLGIDRYAKDPAFVSWAKDNRYSRIGGESLYDVFLSNSNITPGSEYYDAALRQQSEIIDLYNTESKPNQKATPQTNGQYENTQTPQQKKLADRLNRLKENRRRLIDNENIPEAFKLKSEIEQLEAELLTNR